VTLKSRHGEAPTPPPPTVLLTASHGTPTTIMGCKELHRLLTVSLGVRVFSGSLHRIAGKSFSSAVVRGGVRSAPPPSKPLASSNLKPRAATRSGESEAGTPGRRASAPTPVSRVVNIIDLAGVANKTLKGGAPQAVRRHAPPTGTGTQASGHEAATAGLSADSDTQCDPCDTLQGLYLAARHSVTVRGGAASTSPAPTRDAGTGPGGAGTHAAQPDPASEDPEAAYLNLVHQAFANRICDAVSHIVADADRVRRRVLLQVPLAVVAFNLKFRARRP
jgi:hypothetical protein